MLHLACLSVVFIVVCGGILMCSVFSVVRDRFVGIWNQESRAIAYGIAGGGEVLLARCLVVRR